MTRLITLIFVFVSLEMYGQVSISSPVPATELICPGTYTKYEINGSNFNVCGTITWSLKEGSAGEFLDHVQTGDHVYIKWSDQNPNKVTVKANLEYVASNEDCLATHTGTTVTFTHILRSVTSEALQIGDTSVDIPYCPDSQPPVFLTVGPMYIKNTGQPGQPPQAEVERYEWILPAGWRIVNTHETGTYLTPLHAIEIEPSNTGGICSGGGNVKVSGIASGVISCVGIAPSVSNQSTITLTRAPIISLAAPPGYGGPTCNNEAPVPFAATPLSCSIQYLWSYPSGWSGPTTTSTNVVTLTPSENPSDGISGGNEGKIKVSANLGACLVKAAYQLTYHNPILAISGTGPVCTSGKTFSVNSPANSSTSWSTQPSTFLVSGSGTGSSALLRGANPGSGGYTTLTFSVQNTECAISEVLNKSSIWVGPPKVLDYQGNPSTITLVGNTSFARSPFPCIERSSVAYTYTYYVEIGATDYTKIKGMTGT